jgi:D-beta-D-heptose 7-phosphate kinase/D-beta-D-heptose 1-phosphate adenosyltransferase
MIINQNDLANIRKHYSNQKLVLTAGTFDLFHVGHLEFLENTKKYGDVVVLMLSGDNRVKARKGPKRPIIPEAERAKILDALKIVDYVFIDPSTLSPKEIDPIHKTILQNLNPDFYVTDGPDPRFVRLLDESKFITLERDESKVHKSTTEIIKQIIKLNCD